MTRNQKKSLEIVKSNQFENEENFKPENKSNNKRGRKKKDKNFNQEINILLRKKYNKDSISFEHFKRIEYKDKNLSKHRSNSMNLRPNRKYNINNTSNDNLINTFEYYDINKKLNIITLKKIQNGNSYFNNNKTNIDDDINVRIKREKNDSKNDKDLLGHKRKRTNNRKGIKREPTKEKEVKKFKKETRIKKEKIEEKKEIKIKQEIKIKKEKTAFQYPKKKNKIKKENTNNINESSKIENNFSKNKSKKNDKKEIKKNNSMKRKNEQIKKINENETDFFRVINVRSLSDCKKENKNSDFYHNNFEEYYENNENNILNYNNIKNEKEDLPETKIIEIKNEEKEESNNDIDMENDNFISPNKNSVEYIDDNIISINKKDIEIDNIDDEIDINKFSFKEIDYNSSSLVLENSLSFSFPLEDEEKINIINDRSYFSKNSHYIKYNPIDQYLNPIPPENKKPLFSKIGKTPKYVFAKKDNMFIDSDNDITDITSYDIDNNEFPSILTIPRIKPCKEEHIKMIKNKLKLDGIKEFQTENEKMKIIEQNIYLGSFMLYDEKNNIKVYVPIYQDNERMKQFVKKKNLEIIEFEEDNDIDTDEEQLELEIERNNEALLSFMEKVEKEKDYVEKNLNRKKLK